MTRRAAGWPLVIAGAGLVCIGGGHLIAYRSFQSHPEWYSSSLSSRSGSQRVTRRHQILGRLEIPRIGMSVFVLEGDDEESLSLAAAHLTGTTRVGSPGNAVIAGHRDTVFRSLSKIRLGDRIQMRAGATYDYIVEHLQIVGPDDTAVLQSRDGSTLTLITCYPFRFIGDAPKRYVVQAKLIHSS